MYSDPDHRQQKRHLLFATMNQLYIGGWEVCAALVLKLMWVYRLKWYVLKVN